MFTELLEFLCWIFPSKNWYNFSLISTDGLYSPKVLPPIIDDPIFDVNWNQKFKMEDEPGTTISIRLARLTVFRKRFSPNMCFRKTNYQCWNHAKTRFILCSVSMDCFLCLVIYYLVPFAFIRRGPEPCFVVVFQTEEEFDLFEPIVQLSRTPRLTDIGRFSYTERTEINTHGKLRALRFWFLR